MDEYAVLVFRDQPFTDGEQIDFAQRFDGELHAKTGISALQKNRFGNEALTDISNLDENGEILQTNDRRRMYRLGNRLWHTDASFQDPPGRYSMLLGRIVPPVPADTEFADMRAAYDALPAETQGHARRAARASLDRVLAPDAGLRVLRETSRTRSRARCIRWSAPSRAPAGARSTSPRTRRAIIDWPVPEGRLLLRDLIEHATQPQFVYRHSWRVGDLVIWDNRATMHRGLPYDDTKYRRELRRVTTLDIPEPAFAAR